MSQHPNLRIPLRLALGATLLATAAVSPRTSFAAPTSSPFAQDGESEQSSARSALEQSGNYDLAPEQVGDCHVGAECVVKLTATTKGEFHVNESYPFKLTLTGAGVEFHGTGGATFTGADFERRGKTIGVMTIKFKPSAKGSMTLTGKYKVCFCTEKECAPSTIDVSIPVTVK
jgi:hypothetical protein